jgi:hypothetical protein
MEAEEIASPTIPFPFPNSKGFSIWISKRGLFVKSKDLTPLPHRLIVIEPSS